MKKSIFCIAALAMTIQTATAQDTGRQLTVIGASTGTTTVPSSFDPTEIFNVRPVIGMFFDDRCSQVSFTLNASVPANPGSANEIAPADLEAPLQAALDTWNDNPSSFIEMNLDNTTPLGFRPRVGGDFINEVVFLTPDDATVSGSAVSTALIQDSTFIAGEDLDGDGDADVYDPAALGINVCSDIDSDGDIEFPAGDYVAGTILDSDVQFSDTDSTGFAVEASDSSGFDVQGFSLHEFGHAHGLSHSMINQTSPEDANGATMYAFTDSTDVVTELAIRVLDVDDLAASAFLYPEGKNTTPNTELQAGDIAFSDAYSVLTGTVSNSDGSPVLSAAVSSVEARGLSDRGRRGFSTSTRLTQTFTGANSTVVFENQFGNWIFSESVTETSGDYQLPVPVRTALTANIEAVDGFPLAPANIGLPAIIAGFVSNTSFPEENSGRRESANEIFGDTAATFSTSPNRFPRPRDFITNDEETLSNTSNFDFAFNSAIIGASDLKYAEMFDRELLLDIIFQGEEVFTGGTFTTPSLSGNRSSSSDFNRAQLALGTIDADTGNVTITEVIDEDNEFIAQEAELSPYNFSNPLSVSFSLASQLLANPELQVFLIAEANDIVPVRDNIPNALIAQSSAADTAGTSFLSVDNGPLIPLPFDGTYNIQIRSVVDPDAIIPRFLGN